MYDLDGDDKISRDELLAVLHMMVGANISDDQVSFAYSFNKICCQAHLVRSLEIPCIELSHSPT